MVVLIWINTTEHELWSDFLYTIFVGKSFIVALIKHLFHYMIITQPLHKMLGHIKYTTQPFCRGWDQDVIILNRHILYPLSHTSLSLSCDRQELGARRDFIWHFSRWDMIVW